MIQLDCSVQNCKYNEDHCCCKDNIQVDGSSARRSNETCCGSFVEKTTDAVSNMSLEPAKPTNVACKADMCKYNDNRKCHADSIDIQGKNACCCGETECATFCCD